MQNSTHHHTVDHQSFWQNRYGHHLSAQDDCNIAQNLVGFFQVLAEWDRADSAKMPKKSKDEGRES